MSIKSLEKSLFENIVRLQGSDGSSRTCIARCNFSSKSNKDLKLLCSDLEDYQNDPESSFKYRAFDNILSYKSCIVGVFPREDLVSLSNQIFNLFKHTFPELDCSSIEKFRVLNKGLSYLIICLYCKDSKDLYLYRFVYSSVKVARIVNGISVPVEAKSKIKPCGTSARLKEISGCENVIFYDLFSKDSDELFDSGDRIVSKINSLVDKNNKLRDFICPLVVSQEDDSKVFICRVQEDFVVCSPNLIGVVEEMRSLIFDNPVIITKQQVFDAVPNYYEKLSCSLKNNIKGKEIWNVLTKDGMFYDTEVILKYRDEYLHPEKKFLYAISIEEIKDYNGVTLFYSVVRRSVSGVSSTGELQYTSGTVEIIATILKSEREKIETILESGTNYSEISKYWIGRGTFRLKKLIDTSTNMLVYFVKPRVPTVEYVCSYSKQKHTISSGFCPKNLSLQDISKLLKGYLKSIDYKFSENSKRYIFVAYLYKDNKVLKSQTQGIYSSYSLEDCKKILSNKKSGRYLIIKYSEDSVAGQYLYDCSSKTLKDLSKKEC